MYWIATTTTISLIDNIWLHIWFFSGKKKSLILLLLSYLIVCLFCHSPRLPNLIWVIKSLLFAAVSDEHWYRFSRVASISKKCRIHRSRWAQWSRKSYQVRISSLNISLQPNNGSVCWKVTAPRRPNQCRINWKWMHCFTYSLQQRTCIWAPRFLTKVTWP